MTVNEKTTYKELRPYEKYLNEKAIADLKKAAERAYGSMYELTFVQFLQACGGDFSSILGDETKQTAMQHYWRLRFEDFKKEFDEALKNTNVPLTAKQKRASEGIPPQTFAESMLTFCLRYFGLHSFHEAEQVKIGEILIARRDAYNTALFERNMQRIEMEAMKGNKQ